MFSKELAKAAGQKVVSKVKHGEHPAERIERRKSASNDTKSSSYVVPDSASDDGSTDFL